MAGKREWTNFRIDIPAIESILNYNFRNKDLLKEALESYHRLEFLGDAVLEFLIAINVYKSCERIDKGTFVGLVKKNVENSVLGRAAIKHGFHDFLLNEDLKSECNKIKKVMVDESRSESDVGRPAKVLANLIEATAGAVLVDNDYLFDIVWNVFQPLLNPLLSPEPKHHTMETRENKSHEHNIDASSCITNPSTSETRAMKEKAVSKKCNCDEVKKCIENSISKLNNPSYMSNVLDEIEEKLLYNFKRRNLLKDSFCKRLEMVTLNIRPCKECNEAIESAGLKSHEPMEFLGNLFLKLEITIFLHKNYPDLQPGMLTTLRSNSMDNEKLARIAVFKLEVHKHLVISNKSLEDKVKKFVSDIEKNCNDVNPPSVLFEVVESIAGAMLLDTTGESLQNITSGLKGVWEIFKILLEPFATPETVEKHPVAELNEFCQKRRKKVVYKDHKLKVSEEEIIVVEVFIDGEMVGRGDNKKKEVAKKMAARSALEQKRKIEEIGSESEKEHKRKIEEIESETKRTRMKRE